MVRGHRGATAWSGIRPDLWCFGKVIGGGLPVGAFGGRRDVLAVLAPDGPVYQAGTLSGNPLATAAGLAVLGTVDDDAYGDLAGRVARLAAGLEAALVEVVRSAGEGVDVHVPRVGPLFGLAFVPAGSGPVRDVEGAHAAAATGVYARLFRALLRRGVAVAPGPYEVAFPSMAHTDADLDRTVTVAAEALTEALAHPEP